jgi:predicted metal-dependent hydrolase
MSNDLRLSRVGISIRHLPLKIAAHTKQGSLHHSKFSKVHIGPRFAHSFQPSNIYDYITKFCRRQAEAIQNHANEHVRGIIQGEARHIKYKMLKLGGGQAHDLSSD